MASISKMVQWAVDTCADPKVGYGTDDIRNAGVDSSGITRYDCSSFVNFALNAGYFVTPSYAPNYNSFWTGNMSAELERLGFHAVSADGTYMQGDIGVDVSGGHTEICYEGGDGNGVFMGAHTANADLQYQVSIGSSTGNTEYRRSFQYLYRYTGEDNDTPVGGDGGQVDTPDPGTQEPTFSFYVCAAICGNFWRESHVDPGAWENLTTSATWTDLRVGYGLGQWTNVGTSEGRLYQLYKWLIDTGYAVTSGNGQVAYITEENYWNGSTDNPEPLREFLTSDSTDIEELTREWCTGWEGLNWSAEGTGAEERLNFAEECLPYLQEHWNDSAITTWYTDNRWLSTAEALNNAVLVYRAFNGMPNDEGGDDKNPETPDTGTTEPQPDPEPPVGVDYADMFYALLGRLGDSDNSNIKIIHRR